jgi:hypothetical protein
MLVSAEARWFWREAPPDGLERWFTQRPLAAGGGKPRTDEYLLDAGQQELGIKKRGDPSERSDTDGIEVKGLVETRTRLQAPIVARVQIWAKWKSSALRIDGLPRIMVRKTRRLRKFDTGGSAVCELALDADEKLIDRSAPLPAIGCHMELVSLEVGDRRARWGAFAFEAFGPLDTVADSLARTIQHLQPIDAALLSGGLELGYPAWLSTEIVS